MKGKWERERRNEGEISWRKGMGNREKEEEEGDGRFSRNSKEGLEELYQEGEVRRKGVEGEKLERVGWGKEVEDGGKKYRRRGDYVRRKGTEGGKREREADG